MFTTAPTSMSGALTGARMRVCGTNPAVITDTAWYTPAMDAFSGFGHKHPARRLPSLT